MGVTASRGGELDGGGGGVGGGGAKSIRRSLRRMSNRALRRSSPSLSHSFSAAGGYPGYGACGEVCLVNVNTATEEQLMTLPGVSRALAQAIVEHRQTIGRFRRIDDVALVSGMGAERLNIIRAEICVRKSISNTSSRTQSMDSVRSSDSSRLQLNINTVSVFQLQCVPGLNQELAANIVDYRQKKGNFKSIDDLIKVKGIDKIRLSGIKSYLNLFSTPKTTEIVNGLNKVESMVNGNNVSNIPVNKNNISNGTVFGPKMNGHRKTLSMPLKYTPNFVNGFSLNSVNDIFDLLSAYSHRPVVEYDFNYIRNDMSAFRISTWNLHQLSCEKANNPGFREVVCRTILENRFSIICIQDILDGEALKIICDELNSPVLRRIIEWKDNSRKWQYYIENKPYFNSKSVGFIYETYNSDMHIQMLLNNNMDTMKNRDSSQVPNFNYGCIEFKINDTYMTILNVQFTEKNPEYSITLLCEMVDKLLSIDKKVVIVGDFYSVVHINDLSTCYKSLIDPNANTLTTINIANAVGAGGILITNENFDCYTGIAGLVRSGLCHLAIPCGWTWGGPASPFCPVWSEFYAMNFIE